VEIIKAFNIDKTGWLITGLFSFKPNQIK